MKTKVLLVLFAVLSVAATASSQQLLQHKTEGGITFISGGVGMAEREALKNVEGDYNLRLLFATQGTGEFIADVKVTIRDSKGNVVLDAVSDGPSFFAKLPPGSYKVTADNKGEPQTRSVVVSSKRPVKQAFYWKLVHRDKPIE